MAAEIGLFFGAHGAQARKTGMSGIAGCYGSLMSGHIAVAARALHSGSETCEIQRAIVNGAGGMALEAITGIGLSHAPSGGLLKVLWGFVVRAQSGIQSIERGIKADAAFIPMAVALEQVCLSRFTLTKRPT